MENAANVELQFGTGISGMCYYAIGQNSKKQTELDNKKELFIKAFNAYIKCN